MLDFEIILTVQKSENVYTSENIYFFLILGAITVLNGDFMSASMLKS
jgi:hypothetical protein